jgi:organic hydroperoxide reductase OsmC/OhrA
VSEYLATVSWERRGARFVDNRYSRAHRWEFDGGVVVPASASPHVVRLPLSDPNAVDPEEAFVAALASCHMLMFLSIAAKRGFCVESYRDEAVGILAKNAEGKLAITSATLRPHTAFTGDAIPTADVLREMHEEAHEGCFIASSVKTELTTIPTFDVVTAAVP